VLIPGDEPFFAIAEDSGTEIHRIDGSTIDSEIKPYGEYSCQAPYVSGTPSGQKSDAKSPECDSKNHLILRGIVPMPSSDHGG